MTSCDYFEQEGLREIEEGRSIDAHVASCAECQAMQRAHERLRDGIASTAARHQPPPGWQGQVWARIAERRRRPAWMGWLAPAGLAAAAIVAGVAFWTRARPPGPGFVVAIDAPEGTVRGHAAAIGSRLRLDASMDGAPFTELRVYRGDTVLALRCSADPPCRREDGRVQATLALSAVGTYQPVVLRSDRALPEPSSTLDRDAAAALAAGARVELGPPVDVR